MTGNTTTRRALGPAIATTSLGFLVVQLDVSIVNVALNRIGSSLSASMAELQWVVDAYTLAFAAALLSGGALGDRIGARRAYVGGMAVFTVASVLCGLAPGAGALIAARAAQGFGAAVLMPCSLALLTHACGDDAAARARAVGLWTAAGSVSLSSGPLIGGLLVDYVGWPSIFFVNAPIGAAAIWSAFRFLEETPPGGGGLDLAGQALAAVALFAATGSVIEIGSQGLSGLVLLGFGVAVLAAVAFVIVEARQSQPMLPLGFFRSSTFSAATLAGFGINFTLYGALFLLGLYFQQARGLSPAATGVAFLPLMVSTGIANILGGRLTAKSGSRTPIVLGLLAAAAGFAATATAARGASNLALVGCLLPVFIGVGLAVPAMTAAILSAVPKSRSGVASGVLNTVRQTAGAMGVAAFGAIAASSVAGGLVRASWLAAGLLLATGAVAAFGIQAGAKKT